MEDNGRYIPDEIPRMFWKTVEKSKGDAQRLRVELMKMSAEDITNFYWNYEEAVAQIKPFYYDLSMFSEDSIDEICYWIVAQGADVYKALWDDPERAIANTNSLFSQLRSDPGLVGETITVYKEKFHEYPPEKKHQYFVS